MSDIPKIIHYCWFGRGEKPEYVNTYIKGWKSILPEYQLMEWNEDNFDISKSNAYVKEAYEVGKYAFVSDYVRVQALYHRGGIYLDTDVEILKRFDEHLEDARMVLGFESEGSLLTAFIAADKEHPIMEEFMNSYETRHFITADGTYDTTTVNAEFSRLMERHGVNLAENVYQEPKPGIRVYPVEYFCGFDVKNWHTNIGKETCTVHHMASSWVSKSQSVKRKVIGLLQNILGIRRYDRLKSLLK